MNNLSPLKYCDTNKKMAVSSHFLVVKTKKKRPLAKIFKQSYVPDPKDWRYSFSYACDKINFR